MKNFEWELRTVVDSVEHLNDISRRQMALYTRRSRHLKKEGASLLLQFQMGRAGQEGGQSSV